MFGLVLAFVHWGYVYLVHCIIVEHIPECLVWWGFVSYVSYYPTLGHIPILEFIRSFADSLTARSISWSLWVITLGHTPYPWVYQVFCVLSHCSIYFLIFVSHHTGTYPILGLFLLGNTPFSLGLPCLVLISWLTDAFVDLWGIPPLSFSFGASPHCHLRLGHPPTVISFGASPHCHLRLGHPPTVVYVWGIPPLSFTFGASPHSHFFWGIPPLSFRLGHPPIFILFKVFPYRQFA